jgi:Uncharacterised protein family (UPF0158)
VVAISFEDLWFAFDFVSSVAPSESSAYVSLDTGQIYCTSELSPVDEEVPADLETSDRYIPVPHKTELNLGKGLALRFVASELPDSYDRVAGFFRHRGAYARFKDLLDSEGALERWYRYEAEASEKALRDWCAENDIRLVGASEIPGHK